MAWVAYEARRHIIKVEHAIELDHAVELVDVARRVERVGTVLGAIEGAVLGAVVVVTPIPDKVRISNIQVV